MSGEPNNDPAYAVWVEATGRAQGPSRYRSFMFWRMARMAEGLTDRDGLLEAARRAVPQTGLG